MSQRFPTTRFFFISEVESDLAAFKEKADAIFANRFDEFVLGDMADKGYTQDLFRRINDDIHRNVGKEKSMTLRCSGARECLEMEGTYRQ